MHDAVLIKPICAICALIFGEIVASCRAVIVPTMSSGCAIGPILRFRQAHAHDRHLGVALIRGAAAMPAPSGDDENQSAIAAPICSGGGAERQVFIGRRRIHQRGVIIWFLHSPAAS